MRMAHGIQSDGKTHCCHESAPPIGSQTHRSKLTVLFICRPPRLVARSVSLMTSKPSSVRSMPCLPSLMDVTCGAAPCSV